MEKLSIFILIKMKRKTLTEERICQIIKRELEMRDHKIIRLINKCFQKELQLEKTFTAIKYAYKTQKWKR